MKQSQTKEFEESMELARTLLGGHESQADLWEANEAVNRALRAKPTQADAWLLKCQILSALEDDPAALAAAEMALRRAPRRAEAHFFRASVLADMGRYPDALKSLDRAQTLRQPHEDWLLEDLYYERAAILDATGHPDEALAIFEEGLQKCPQSQMLQAGLEPLRRARLRQKLTVLKGGRR